MPARRSRPAQEDKVNRIAQCTKCKIWKPFSDYTIIRSGEGRRHTQSSCKECCNAWSRNKIKLARESSIEAESKCESKECNSCHEVKPLICFPKYSGQHYRAVYRTKCKDCINARQNERYHKKNLSRRERSRERQTTVMGRASRMHGTTKARCKHAGIPYSLDKQWFIDRLGKGACEVTGLPFLLTTGTDRRNLYAPSIDRIDPLGGYTPENCHLTLLCYNLAKCDGEHRIVVDMSNAIACRWSHENAVLSSMETSLDYD